MAQTCIHWVPQGLRLHDNPALMAALRDCRKLYPVFIPRTPYLHNNTSVGINRWRFLIGALKDLDGSLRKLNSSSGVDVRARSSLNVSAMLSTNLSVGECTVIKKKTESVSCDACLKGNFRGRRFKCLICYDYDLCASCYESGATTTRHTTEHPMQCILTRVDYDLYYGGDTFSVDQPQSFTCPYCGKMGYTETSLQEHVTSEHAETSTEVGWVCSFEKPQTSPNSLTPSTTVLSPYVTFGCLSARTFWWRLTDVYQGKKHSDPPVSLHGQLLWREFYYTASVGIPNFNKMEGNSVCTQVDWDTNPEYLAAWTEARTGFPFIDAIMTQLRQEGWIHHLARHAVACFLTRGDLWISWEEGQKVFEELLLDGDWALNAGNWMWLSASAFFHQFFRVYSPVAFGKKTDKNGDYIKKYLPLLKKFPAAYIYEPWKAPRSVQQAAGCIVGKDYPHPIVQHEVISKKNIQRMKLAYAKRSTDPAESPSKKQGVKRKAPSVVDMLTKKERKK
ncbi:LOW QUALITY PROTEIN: cryptochrome-2-like [Morone saxatilis]|uniref:LOW QUALITY PROTEIN: cryptochrome-2-like n=1 Tax=Morone saxatilis TaxID=34816 RepID=UPI0015E1BCD1|nr:LOW QUALITY PROTEIN: cryptochrome-2-like [Morone saxatilis]